MGRGGEIQQCNWCMFVNCYCFIVVVVEVGGSDCVVSDWYLLWFYYLIVCYYVGYVVVVNGYQEGFFCYSWQMQYMFYCVCNGDFFMGQCVVFCFQCLYIVGYFWCFIKQDVQWQIDWLIIKMMIVQRKMQFFGCFINYCVGCVFMFIQFVKQW